MESRNFSNMKHGRGKALAVVTVVAAGLALAGMMIPGAAQAQSSVRSWGMGGTGVATARGLDAVQYNPAILGFSQGSSLGLAAAAVDVQNNAISLDRYNEITGSHLATADKEQLLNDIPDGGFQLDADVRASIFGFQKGPFALSFNAVGAGSGNLDKDYFDLVLFGNQVGETVDFSNTSGEGYAYGSAAVSYGTILSRTPGSSLSFGVSAKYLQGIYEMHVEDSFGTLTTGQEAIAGDAYVSTLSSEGGRGYGLDMGLALQTTRGWTLGLSMENLYTTISWDTNVEERQYQASATDLNALNDDLSRAVVNSDTTLSAGTYSTDLPRQLRFGAANHFGPLELALDYVQGFENRGTTSTTPQFHLGTEWSLAGFIQPRLGVSTGGALGSGASAGLGMRLGFWTVDLAAVTHGSLNPNQTSGVGFAAGTSLVF